MRKASYYCLVFTVLLGFITSCEKKDNPVAIPQKMGSQYAMVEMGEDYTNQIFYDFQTAKVVYVSAIKSWDFAFETSPLGHHVFMNGGGKNIYVFNTHQTDMKSVQVAPKIKDNEWLFDADCGLPDSTGIGEWLNGNTSKNEVYIVKLDPYLFPDTFKKIQLLSVSDNNYVLAYADLKSDITNTIIIPKNTNFNYVYFSFDNNGMIVNPEPPKNTWDVVFTRYRHIYHELENFSYPVNGVLINPYSTTAAKDSTTPYEKVQSALLTSLKFSNMRDVIGFDWKFFDRTQPTISKYVVDRNKIFFVKTRNEEYYKMHFLDFYNSQGVKGCPSFEFERLQ
jgi:hypothetical protein